MTHGKSGGTGLGLAISKAVVDAHGGKISVTNTGPAGTTFAVDLPLPATES
jgi:signal transduction histidine kinase